MSSLAYNKSLISHNPYCRYISRHGKFAPTFIPPLDSNTRVQKGDVYGWIEKELNPLIIKARLNHRDEPRNQQGLSQ
jgi:hypothetical protein